MASSISDVVVLCWGVPTKSDRSAGKIAAFLGVDATFISLSGAGLSDVTSIPKLGPRGKCLIVDVETLAKAADAMQFQVYGLRALTDLAEHIFIYGFEPTERHGAILQELSSGGLLGVRPLPDPDARFQVTEGHREWCRQFCGLSFEVLDPAREDSFLEGTEQQRQAVIIRAGGKPFFVHTELHRSQAFLLACGELADLDEPVERGERLLSWFSRLVPLMMFLRGALGERVWHNDQPRACLIIDDPLLRESYGFLDYRRLADSMGQHRFAMSIAFIPWNYRRSSMKVAKLFSSSDGRAFLCVHGCDHTGAEFAPTQSETLLGKAKLALQRMQAHRLLFGVPFDDVMVFPQGLFSVEAMIALRTSGYLAAVNSDVYPFTTSETLALRDLLDVAVTRFADFPLFGRRYPTDFAGFAFDLFMGKPALAVEHHGYFRNGYKALENFVERLNSLDPQLEWTNLGTICSSACLTRTAHGGDVLVRFYTNRFSLKNNGAQARRYVLLKRRTHSGRSPSVTVNGREWSCEREDEELKIQLSLDAGQMAYINVLSDRIDSELAPWSGTAIHNARVRIRRFLCEFRDNHVDTNPVLNAIVSAIRSFCRENETASGSVIVSPLCRTEPRPLRRSMPAKLPTYVLVTPARNEAAFIEKTIASVVAQTTRPVKWVIVSDGSTDSTDAIVRKWVAHHDWIELVSLPERAERHFAGKVAAFNAGQARLAGVGYEVIVNLDADVSFDEGYFSFLLGKLAQDPTLGLVGTPYKDTLNQVYDYRFVSRESVTGPCQVFRRECFEAIGGYSPVKGGNIDRIADITARMKGWKTRIYTDKIYLHHRHTGTAQRNILMAKFQEGVKDYCIGSSPIWELSRTVYQSTRKPYVFGGLMLGAGYFWSAIRRLERPVSDEMVKFYRREQMIRLKMFFAGRTLRNRQST